MHTLTLIHTDSYTHTHTHTLIHTHPYTQTHTHRLIHTHSHGHSQLGKDRGQGERESHKEGHERDTRTLESGVGGTDRRNERNYSAPKDTGTQFIMEAKETEARYSRQRERDSE